MSQSHRYQPSLRCRRLRRDRVRRAAARRRSRQHAPEGTRIALAGRSLAKLEAVRAELPGAARDWPLVVADAADERRLRRPGRVDHRRGDDRRAVPQYGLPLARACAEAGTHYADLTGEVLFVREVDRRVRRGRARHGRPDRHGLRLRLDPLRPRRAAAARASGSRTAPVGCWTPRCWPAPRAACQRRHHRLLARPDRRGRRRTAGSRRSSSTPTP